MIILEVNEVQRTLKASGAGAFVVHDKEVDIVLMLMRMRSLTIMVTGASR